MAKPTKRRSKKAGLPPGSLIYVGERVSGPVKISVFDYSATHFEEKQVEKVADCLAYRDTPTITWINVDGIHDAEIVKAIGNHFNIHHLILEDILNTQQRPKKDDMGDYIHICLKMLYMDEKSENVFSEHVSLILGANYVISFQEGGRDVFNPVRERLRGGKGRMRKMGSDYLAYALVDNIVDNYFSVLESFGDKINLLEEELVNEPTTQTLRALYASKRTLLYLRKSVWPLREVIGALNRLESVLIQQQTEIYLRDVYGHTIEVMDIIETYRDMQAGMLDTYLSSISNRLNSIMQVLTTITVIFMPLSFIAGVYGMNFHYMPELEWKYGYPLAMGLMAAVVGIMLLFFRKRGWI